METRGEKSTLQDSEDVVIGRRCKLGGRMLASSCVFLNDWH